MARVRKPFKDRAQAETYFKFMQDLACMAAGITYDCFKKWRQNDPAFDAEVEQAAAEPAVKLFKTNREQASRQANSPPAKAPYAPIICSARHGGPSQIVQRRSPHVRAAAAPYR